MGVFRVASAFDQENLSDDNSRAGYPGSTAQPKKYSTVKWASRKSDTSGARDRLSSTAPDVSSKLKSVFDGYDVNRDLKFRGRRSLRHEARSCTEIGNRAA